MKQLRCIRSSTMLSILFLLSIPHYTRTESFLSSKQQTVLRENASIWAPICYSSSTPEELQILANTLYFLYANSLFIIEIQKSITPLFQAIHAIRVNTARSTSSYQEFSELSGYTQYYAEIANMQNMIQQTLVQCENAYTLDANLPAVIQALEFVAFNGQTLLVDWVNHHDQQMCQHLNSLADNFAQTSENFDLVRNFFIELANGDTLLTSADELNKKMLRLDLALDATIKTSIYTDQTTDLLNKTADYIYAVTVVGAEIYKAYYDALYDVMTSASYNVGNHMIMFGPEGVIPREHRSRMLTQSEETARYYTQQITNILSTK